MECHKGLGYRRDYSTQLYYFINHHKDPVIKQPRFNGMSFVGFFVAHNMMRCA